MLSVSLGAEDAGFTATLTSAASAVAGFAGRINSSLGGFREVRSDISGMTGALQQAQNAATPVAAALHTVEAAVRGLGGVSRTVGAAMLLFPRAFSGLPAALTKTIAGVSMAGSAMDAFRGKVGLVGAAMIYAQARALGLQKHWSALAAAVAFGTSQMSKAWNSVSSGPRQVFSSMTAGSLGLQRSMTGLIGQIAAFAGAAGAGALAGLGLKKSISGAADAEDLRTTFRVLLGDSKRAGEAMKEATDFADMTPFDPVPVQEGYKTLLAYGFALKDIKGLMTDAGDLASVMKVNLGDVTKVFGRLQSGDFGEAFERLRDFGISRQDLEAKGLEFDKGGSFQGSAAQAMTAVRAIIQEKFGGTMDAVSQTWNGKWSTLMGYVDAIFREFGTPLIDALKPLLDQGIEYAKQASEMAKQLGQGVATALQVATAAFKSGEIGNLVSLSLQYGFGQAINYLVGGLKGVVDSLMVIGDALRPAFLSTLEWFGAKLTQVLLIAFETPIRSFQAGLTVAVQRVMSNMFNLMAPLLAMMGAKWNPLGIKVQSYDEAYKGTEATFGGRTAAEYGQQAEDAKATAAPLLREAAEKIKADISDIIQKSGPAGIFDTEALQQKLASLVADIQSQIPKTTEPEGKERSPITTASADEGLTKDAVKALPVSSLAKIGGGNYSAAAGSLQREANNLLKQVVKNTADVAKTIAENISAGPGATKGAAYG